jgi:hypothetical protein
VAVVLLLASTALAAVQAQNSYCPVGGLKLVSSGQARASAPNGNPIYSTPGHFQIIYNTWFMPTVARNTLVDAVLVSSLRQYDDGSTRTFAMGWLSDGTFYAGFGIGAGSASCRSTGNQWSVGQWTMLTVVEDPDATGGGDPAHFVVFVNAVKVAECSVNVNGISSFAVSTWNTGSSGRYGEMLIVMRSTSNEIDLAKSAIFDAYSNQSPVTLYNGISFGLTSYPLTFTAREQVLYWTFTITYSSSSNTLTTLAHNSLYNSNAQASLGYPIDMVGTPNTGLSYTPCFCTATPCTASQFTACQDGPSAPVCTCVAGYSGTLCQTDTNECTSNPCQHGTCFDQLNGFACGCISGYTGTLCQSELNECASQPCTNGGTCTDHFNFFTCACVTGFSGTRCQFNIDECASQPCSGGRTCVDMVNGFTCVDGQEPFCHDSLVFNGRSTSAVRSASTFTLQPMQPFTMSMWLAPHQAGVTSVNDSSLFPNHFALVDSVSRSSSAVPRARGFSIGIGLSPLGLTVWYRNVACISSVATIATGWHEYTGAARLVNGTTTMELALFVDGRRVASTSGTCTFPYDSAGAAAVNVGVFVEIGRNTDGALANLRMWNRGLTDTEIRTENTFRSFYTSQTSPLLWFTQQVITPTASAIDVPLTTLGTGAMSYRRQDDSLDTTGFAQRVSFRACRCSMNVVVPISPCAHNATCVDNPSLDLSVPPCNCTSTGYEGYNCAVFNDACMSGPCSNGGTCTNVAGSFVCTCAPGWSDPTCTTESVTLTAVTCPAPLNQTVPVNTTAALTPLRYRVMAQACESLYPLGDHIFDPLTGWCRILSATTPAVNAEMSQYLNLYYSCPELAGNTYVLTPFAAISMASYSSSVSALRATFNASGACGPFRGWSSHDAPYFDDICGIGDDSRSFDFASFSCVTDVREHVCGVGTASCTRQCFANGTCLADSQQCTCAAGHDHGLAPAYCGYKVPTDLCINDPQIGQISKSSTCSVFTRESYYECPSATFNASACTEVCECLAGTGDTPGWPSKCGGQDMDCSTGPDSDAMSFCGSATATCRKRCEFTKPDYTLPQYCAFIEGSCGTNSHLTEDRCDANHTLLATNVLLNTYRYDARLGSATDQFLYQEYASACQCDATRTGFKCTRPSCPLDCSGGHGTCNNGHCTCTGTVANQYTGCGCQMDELPLCMTNSYGCLGGGGATIECEPCSGSGVCASTYTNGIQPNYTCACDTTHSGTFCATPICPNNCRGASHGRCNSTSATCTCTSTASCSGSDLIYAGADCADPVCIECGGTSPDSSFKSICSGHGTCRRDNGTVPYACVCASGYTGAFCENAPCSPPCGLHATCVSTGASFQCQCNTGWIGLTGGTTCITNMCGTRATPVVSGTTFTCQCNNASLDASTCNTNPSDNQRSCCVTPACPRDASTGVVCGDNPTSNLYGISPIPSCNAGTCSCTYPYLRNTTSGTCYPRCSQQNILLNTRPCVLTTSGPTACDHCACKPGYDPASGCYDTICKNGGTLVNNGGNVFCVCPSSWTGSTCAVAPCNGVGSLNVTTPGVCTCPFPYTGTACQTHTCQNGATPRALGGGVYACNCTRAWTGATCAASACGTGGNPISTGVACTCDRVHSGALCDTVLCMNGGTPNVTTANTTRAHCDCSAQYLGIFCETRRCSVAGVYEPVSGECMCLAQSVYARDPATNNCTVSMCGDLGRPNATGLTCTCPAGTVAQTTLSNDHPLFCEPTCLHGGVFVPSYGRCDCPDGTTQPFCALPDAQDSSTGSDRSAAAAASLDSPFVLALVLLVVLGTFL